MPAALFRLTVSMRPVRVGNRVMYMLSTMLSVGRIVISWWTKAMPRRMASEGEWISTVCPSIGSHPRLC